MSILGPCAAILFASACNNADQGASSGPPVSAAARTEARTTFDNVCVSCHGSTGHGDGPAAAAMNPKPRSFGDQSWQASVSDDHIVKVVTLGGAAVGKSPIMPAQPQLKAKSEVLRALVEIVRGFGK